MEITLALLGVVFLNKLSAVCYGDRIGNDVERSCYDGIMNKPIAIGGSSLILYNPKIKNHCGIAHPIVLRMFCFSRVHGLQWE